MRNQLGILACLLAGCVSQPTVATPLATPSPALALAADDHVLRIGLEFLPPDERFPQLNVVRTETLPSEPSAGSPRHPTPGTTISDIPEPSRTPQLSDVAIDAIADPIARETMHFVSDLVDADRRRVRREIGIPFFDFRQIDDDMSPKLHSEQVLQEDHELWVQQNGTSLLQRPLRRMLKRLPIVTQFEVAVEDFRSDHVPLSEPYRQSHSDGRRLGRMSMRVHTNQLSDPVEIVYIRRGVRIGTSQQRGKLSLDFDLGKSFAVSFRARTNYETGDYTVRGDLMYNPSAHMSVHVAIGDDMDFLSTSGMYSLFESAMDGSAGVVIYAVHTF